MDSSLKKKNTEHLFNVPGIVLDFIEMLDTIGINDKKKALTAFTIC